MSIVRFERLFPDEIEALLSETPAVVMPIGTIEWHSHHLPLGLDGLVAGAIGERVAERLGAALLPTSFTAVGGVPFPYTYKLTPEVVGPLLVASYETLAEMGFRVVVAFAGHFGLDHTLTLKRTAIEVMARTPLTILPITEYDLVSEHYTGDHAGKGETSLLWHLYPELVRSERLHDGRPLDGVIGEDPRSSASAAWGATLFEHIASRTAEVAERLLRHTSASERAAYIEALTAGVRVLDATAELRRTGPKSRVPAITTPAYLEHLQALTRGDYRASRAHADRKLSDLAA